MRQYPTITQSQEISVSLDRIHAESCITSREEEHSSIIQHFAKVMQDGGDYPSIMCFSDGKDYRLIYGLNLLKAAELAGQKTVLVDEYPNPSSHKLKNAVKDRMVKKMLSLLDLMGDEEKMNWPNTEIARMCGVSERTVRFKIKEFGYKAPNKIKRATKTGKLSLVETSNIGSQSKLKKRDSIGLPLTTSNLKSLCMK